MKHLQPVVTLTLGTKNYRLFRLACMYSTALSHPHTIALLRVLMSCRHICAFELQFSRGIVGKQAGRHKQNTEHKQQIISPLFSKTLNHKWSFPSKYLTHRFHILVSRKLGFSALLPSARFTRAQKKRKVHLSPRHPKTTNRSEWVRRRHTQHETQKSLNCRHSSSIQVPELNY